MKSTLKYNTVLKSLFLIICLSLLNGMSQPPSSMVKTKDYGTAPTSNESLKGYNEVLRQLTFGGLKPKFNCKLDEGSTEDHCLVCNCVHENGFEPAEGRTNVNRVVYTRELSVHYPNSICKVIMQPSQFSWFNRGKPQKYQLLNASMPAVKNCIKTTAEAKKYRFQWFASNYHANYVSPDWKKGCRNPRRVGTHIFYIGGCYAVKPPTTFPIDSPARGTGWLMDLFGIKSAIAKSTPLDLFLKKNKSYKLKSEFSKDVIKLMGKKNDPAIMTGDFNGDGQEDTVALLIKGDKHLMTFFVSNPKGFKVISKKAYEGDIIYLTKIAKSKIKSGLPAKKSMDLVQLETYMGPTTAYYVKDNKVFEFKGALK